MNQNIWKKSWPYLIAIALFLLITVIYFSPLIEGKKIQAHDTMTYRGGAKEIIDFRNATEEEALWTNSMFSGMPAYQISTVYPSNWMKQIDKVMQLWLPQPAGTVFLYFIGFFILMLAMGADVRLSILGAIAYAFSSYFFIILGAGHNTKAHAIAYMAPVLAGFILTYKGKYLLGGAITAFFLALEIMSNHLQITYYLFLILLIYFIFQLVNAIKEKEFPHFAKATGILFIAGILSILPNISNLWSTYEYSKETIRGKTELTTEAHNRTSGLDKDYATQWSYGIGETFSLMIPNIKGGGTDAIGSTPEALSEVDPQMKDIVGQMNKYWGDQPFTSGPVYVGAIIMFLFLLGAIIVKGPLKWALLTATILSILLSWGKNFMPLTDLFLDYFPFYNKFRAVSTTLVIAELTIPALAILALKQIWDTKDNRNKFLKPFYISAGITAGLSFLFYLMPATFFNFISPTELPQYEQIRQAYGQDVYNTLLMNLETARISIFKADAIRSFFFIIAGSAIVWLFIKNKINGTITTIALIIFILADMYTIDKRYLNNDNFTNATSVEKPFTPTSADKEILKDKDPNFRVLNLTVNTFSDVSTSYFHKSIGGYHAAKLRRYQELYDHHITNNNMAVLNMLNTKYIITSDKNNTPQVIKNPEAMGNGWFVSTYRIVNNADEELKALENFIPAEEAIIDTRFSTLLNSEIGKDSLSQITLTSYKPNELKYKTDNNSNGLAVFSEIYYDKGWNAYLDGKKVPYLRANYILRAINIPAGQHELIFKFEPKSYYIGEKIALAGSLILILMVLAAAYSEIKNRCKQQKTNSTKK